MSEATANSNSLEQTGHGSTSKYDVLLPLQGHIRPRRIHLKRFAADTQEGSVLAYLGIPFAQAPTGSRRWKVPQGPLPSWSTTRASKWQSDPHQDFASMEGMYRGRKGAKAAIPRSEDCLYLNVWVPETDGAAAVEAKRPVLVWIYGGAFSVGNCSRPLHDGARLAHESGCIVVSLTYRVGAMGFLGSRSMAQEAAGDWPLVTLESLQSKPASSQVADVGAGNWGLWDLISGLLWVQHAISTFGGDCSNVTVFGESAGSIAIHYLLLSGVTPEGLFQKAVLQSGVVATLLPRTTQAVQATFDLLVRSLCPYHLEGDEAAQLEYLRTKVSADEIASCLRPLVGKRPRSEYTPLLSDRQRLPRAREDLTGEAFGVTDQWGPVWDGVLVDADFVERALGPLPPKSQLRNGRSGVVVGMCADEGTMFNFLIATTQSLAAHQELFDPALSSDLGRLYGFDARSLAATKTSGREKALRDQEAFYTCATYTGDAQFTAPILDYMAMQSRASVGESDRDGRVDVYGYLLAYRPSSAMLEALTVVPEMTEEWAAFHTLDIPLVFGLTGSSELDGHAFASDMSQYGVDPDEGDSRPSAPSRSNSTGMTEQEKQLNLNMMRTWTAVARLSTSGDGGEKVGLPDGSTWLPFGSTAGRESEPAGIDRIHLLAFGEAPQAPAKLTATSSDHPIRVWQTALSQHAFAQQQQQQSVSVGGLQARVRFWMHEPITGTCSSSSQSQADGAQIGKVRMCRSMQNYYGFLSTPPRFLPWSPA
ncbi:related to Acetylcholinesterase precursor [Sporisorium reilianum f. sp. reilianum]|uniref:Related to Acetylcholinesterase n=1 Tax=Sporisorium reilianum f. sp. reilianum TaxID=72559 RepID=A0A2N8UEC9_9BASI|nr:related to Acetylcholinesterase precursor [Sporisorium reilianum f. sp. reilianum]